MKTEMARLGFTDKIAVTLLILMTLMTLFGMFLFGVSFYIDHTNQPYYTLEQTGIAVMSEPLERYTKVSDDISYHYEIKPKFTTKTSENRQCTDQIADENLAQLVNKPSVMVYYQSDNPSICQVKGSQWRRQNFESARRWAWILMISGTGILILALIYRKRNRKH